MIPYEEYNNNGHDEDDIFDKLPLPAIVITIALFSLVGIYSLPSCIWSLILPEYINFTDRWKKKSICPECGGELDDLGLSSLVD